MVMIKAAAIALSTYTVLPVGHFTWEEKPMRYSICFLPLAGVLVGALLLLWRWLSGLLGAGDTLYAAFAAALPALLTGGIHLDGYLDTVDALSSHAPREKKLAIMKDPRAGAFSIIWGGVYFLLLFGLFSTLRGRSALLIAAIGYVLARALTAFSALTQRNARSEGLLVSFTAHAPRVLCRIAMAVLVLLCAAAMLEIDLFIGGLALLAAALGYLCCYFLCERVFGGVTGDTCGFSISLIELACCLGAALGTLILAA